MEDDRDMGDVLKQGAGSVPSGDSQDAGGAPAATVGGSGSAGEKQVITDASGSWTASQQDIAYMQRALELAERGLGFTNPNPMVGAVIVKDGRVIGEGYHHRYGDLHAERDALSNCSEDPAGAAIYVSLEPCCHHGKQPPCTDALIAAGISRVVIGSSDPNPLVAGNGIRILREHGIEVCGNVCEEQALALNEPFFHYITTGLPLVVLKYAMTMDGKIATCTGESRWITGEEARRNVHRDRSRYASIMVGSGTVAADDPMLTSRIEGGHDPLRIVVDGTLSIGTGCKLVQTAREVPTLIVTCVPAGDEGTRAYEDLGCEVLSMPSEDGRHVDLRALVAELGRRSIDSLFIESGSSLAWAALEAGIVDKVQAYIAPKMFGGAGAPSPVGGSGIGSICDCVRLLDPQVQMFGEDILITSEVESCSRE